MKQSYSTAAVHPAARLDYYCEIVARHFIPFDVGCNTIPDEDFFGVLTKTNLYVNLTPLINMAGKRIDGSRGAGRVASDFMQTTAYGISPRYLSKLFEGEIGLVGAMYDLNSGKVEFYK